MTAKQEIIVDSCLTYEERLHRFNIEAASKYRRGKLDVYHLWVSEHLEFLVYHSRASGPLKTMLEGMSVVVAEHVAKNGTKQEQETIRGYILQDLKHHPESSHFLKAAEILGSFSTATKAVQGRKTLGIPKKHLDCVSDIYEHRKENDCFVLPENGEIILGEGLELSVKAIERQDRKTNVADWISEIATTHPLPLCVERLTKLYTKQRRALIVHDLFNILHFGSVDPFSS
jgi:hypothetical protein